jgi:hypothetical protein
MQVQPSVTQVNGIVTVTMKAAFVGDPTDATDQQRITAYGDPIVNLGGLFTDPNDASFKFTFPAQQKFVGITTAMANYPVRFMTALPLVPPSGTQWNPYVPTNPFRTSSEEWGSTFPGGIPATQQGALDCVVTDPVRAATIWATAIDTQIQAAVAILRTKTPVQLTSLPNATI